nr:alpha-galactosidase [Planctomycetota bacterium]
MNTANAATPITHTFASASVTLNAAELRVTTGLVTQTWRLLDHGLATISLRHHDSAREWIDQTATPRCDWQLIGVIDDHSSADYGELHIATVRDATDTDDHLVCELPVRYHQAGFELCWRLWLFPGAPGIRSQLTVRALREMSHDETPTFLGPSHSARLALAPGLTAGRVAGYYNDTQHRNYAEFPIIREQALNPSQADTVDWASALQVQADDSCLSLVKESHKCVNQNGIDTGAFVFDPSSVRVTGLGIAGGYGHGPWPRRERARACWACWTILSCGTLDDGRAAIKTFDQHRYPFRAKRDALIMANTWGSRGAGEGSRSAAEQDNVLREIDSCADLGVDIIQIDDGWQCEPGADKPFSVDWTPNPTRFPDGWTTVREHAAQRKVALGLWQPWGVEVDSIVRNRAAGGFRRFKIDFISLGGPDDLERLCDKAAEIVARTGPECGINWDATENNVRMG